MVLYINSCVRKASRTDFLARKLLARLGEYEEIKLSDENLKPLSEEKLQRRTELISKGNYSDEMFRYAKQFASADTIVISAPFWDLSFPSALKVYFENIYVIGVVSEYNESGFPVGLCKAKKLYYVTTAGGPYIPAFGFDYVRDMSKICFGIDSVELISAENLDIIGADADEIIGKAAAEIEKIQL